MMADKNGLLIPIINSKEPVSKSDARYAEGLKYMIRTAFRRTYVFTAR